MCGPSITACFSFFFSGCSFIEDNFTIFCSTHKVSIICCRDHFTFKEKIIHLNLLLFFSSVTTSSPDLVVFFSCPALLFSPTVCLEVMTSIIECFHQALLVVKEASCFLHFDP